MFLRQKLLLAFMTLFLSLSATTNADSVYVISLNLDTNNQQFGTVDLATGAFQQIGGGPGEEYRGLVPASNGSFLTLGFDGNLTSINPVTGAATVIGPTGFSDCSTPSSPCGPRSAGVLAGFGGALYATDFSQNLYRVNSATGAATLIGTTGIPAVPFASHFTSNPDGTANVMSATLFAANGNLYATFDAERLDPASGAITPVISNNLYQIDPSTGRTTIVAPTTGALSAVVEVSGTVYAFNVATEQLLNLNLANGGTSFIADVSGGGPMYVEGATPTPEPISMTLAGIGLAVVIVLRFRKHAV